MSVPRARVLDLMKAQCQIFSTTFNPKGIRTGNKILRQRLRGPALAAYYPPRVVTMRDLVDEFAPLNLEVDNEEADDRLDKIAALKTRGKGTPKKKGAPADTKGGAKKKK